jgi:predicted kinase
MATQKLIMTKGLPGSGKSTWAEEQVLAAPPGSVVRINKDLLRTMLNVDRFKGGKTEKPVLNARDALIDLFLGQGKTVISDDTNLVPSHEIALRQFAVRRAVEFVVKDFTDVPLEVCIERDRQRARTVGPKVITKMYNDFLAPPVSVTEPDPSLPSAIIVDIDGTLAHMDGGRSPYDWARVEQDRVDLEIRRLVQMESAAGTTIIVVSGRDGVCEKDTCAWLTYKGVPHDEFYIRHAGDTRNDAIVKREIYDTHIAGRFNIRYVLDDRNRVVQMWRSLGLRCLQVAEGDF